MSETDELREGLKELGVQYQACSDSLTMWKHDGRTAIYAEYPEGGKLRAFVTPEQAIAATLGTGTCENDAPEPYYFVCSKCGIGLNFNVRFCPFCGRRVKGVD